MLALPASRDPTASPGAGLPAAPRLVGAMDGGGGPLLVRRSKGRPLSMGRRAMARRQAPGRWRGQGRGEEATRRRGDLRGRGRRRVAVGPLGLARGLGVGARISGKEMMAFGGLGRLKISWAGLFFGLFG